MTEGKIAPICVTKRDQIEKFREQAYQRRSDELLGFAELLPLALSEGRVRFPVDATFPDPPDIMLTSYAQTLAIEVSRLTWQRQSQVLAEATKCWPDALVELNHDLRSDGKARRDKGAHKGGRSGDYRAIKLKGERLDGPGSVGDEHLLATVDALGRVLARKCSRLKSYLRRCLTFGCS